MADILGSNRLAALGRVPHTLGYTLIDLATEEAISCMVLTIDVINAFSVTPV